MGSAHDAGVTSYPIAGPNVVWCGDALTCSNRVGRSVLRVGRGRVRNVDAGSVPKASPKLIWHGKVLTSRYGVRMLPSDADWGLVDNIYVIPSPFAGARMVWRSFALICSNGIGEPASNTYTGRGQDQSHVAKSSPKACGKIVWFINVSLYRNGVVRSDAGP